MTFFYSNAMSARLMFYHDHAMGITRLNVYAGEAAGYVVTDAVEQDLINGTNNSGVNPGLISVLPDIGIPLIIQDKTFVDPATIGATDPTWLDPLQTTFGTTPGTAVAGDLWYPHVYVPAQNPWEMTGTNPYGRWMYGPWFYPPTANIDVGPVPNEYCLPYPPGQVPGSTRKLDVWDNSAAPWEPPFRPGTPNPSMPGEGFMDTMMVNGTVYPYLDVDPKAYRFRILNGCNDRFLNLSLYKAATIVGSLTTGTAPPPPPFTAIAMGSGAQDYNNHFGAGYTMIDTNNPANASGIIDTVDIWAYSNLTGVKVGIFYKVSGNVLSARGAPTAIGNVTAGSKQTFSGLSLPVQTGDFIGVYAVTGDVEYSTNLTGAYTYERAGDLTGVANTYFYPSANRHLGLAGYNTPPPPPAGGGGSGSGHGRPDRHHN